MSEYIIELTDDELDMIIATHGVEDCRLFGYQLTGEIVRCRDCVHYDGDEEAPVCKHPRGFHQVKSLRIDLDGFCAWNERRKP